MKVRLCKAWRDEDGNPWPIGTQATVESAGDITTTLKLQNGRSLPVQSDQVGPDAPWQPWPRPKPSPKRRSRPA
jgi:hypothetical protein